MRLCFIISSGDVRYRTEVHTAASPKRHGRLLGQLCPHISMSNPIHPHLVNKYKEIKILIQILRSLSISALSGSSPFALILLS